jgi:hypothetical protein
MRIPLAMAQPVVFRVNRKQVSKIVPRLNKSDIWVESIGRYLDQAALARLVGVPRSTSISAVYVSENREGRLEHRTVPYNEEYARIWGDQPIFGNMIVVLGEKSYNALPEHLKTTDIDAVVV